MSTWIRHRASILIVFACVLFAVTSGVWRYGYGQALDQLARRGEADLALGADSLTAQLKRYQELAVLMAEHPTLLSLTRNPAITSAQRGHPLLLDAADKTAALDIIYARADGTILATAQEDVAPPDALDQTPYFKRALQGALGAHHEVDARFGRRAFYYSVPSFSSEGTVSAVLTVVLDVEDVEGNWRGDGPTVFFVDDLNEVFISNRSELVFWKRNPTSSGLIPPSGTAPPVQSYMRAGHEIWELDWGPYIPAQGLHIVKDLPVIDMVAEAIVDISLARRIAGLQAGTIAAIFMIFGLILLQVLERRRVLTQANAELEQRVTLRTQALSATNEALRREITEREEAEAALKQAQSDLVQAGKLSALGQMSAGISHELNQPLQAIQTFAENGTRFLERENTSKAADNLTRISQMATRMARIIKNLRAFARNESEPMGRVDLVGVISQAVELTEPRLKEHAVTLDWQPDASGPVFAEGGEVRLTQVFVNLINNAIDAMLEQDNRLIHIVINNGRKLGVTVRDIGPGLEDPEKVFDPFYSTKSKGVAEGMGLGLSISYGLVQSFGGNIRGANAAGNGALFTVELNYWKEENVA
ncbi:sensor histidine kinase [Shimia sp. R11_0]|uniref:sensor histidine kinase n=1 Tax=Shimia sp. R11_0 TaxID=2821096 RepID=UPI001AD9F4E1|nr:ATP-binding protein [Shimia sp. R11_0]MBO9477738.1 sensor histidine kinase [Shimia sp. R11_0]